MTDLEARKAIKDIMALGAVQLPAGVAALRKIRDYVNALDLGDVAETTAQPVQKQSRIYRGGSDRMNRGASSRGEEDAGE